MFADYKVTIADHYDDRCEGFELDYASFFKVNEGKKQGFLIAFNLNNAFAKVTHGTISHEVFHAASNLLEDRGLFLNAGSEEAYSYLINWMTDEVYKIISDNQIVI